MELFRKKGGSRNDLRKNLLEASLNLNPLVLDIYLVSSRTLDATRQFYVCMIK
jgi:hypothetical protein